MKLCAIFILTLFGSSESNLKIINGELAMNGQFPHMVQLSIKTPDAPQYCGGSLLNNQWVLTVSLN